MLLSSQLEQEAERRRILFRAAASGDVRAQEELEREYHVRIQCKKSVKVDQQRNRKKTS